MGFNPDLALNGSAATLLYFIAAGKTLALDEEVSFMRFCLYIILYIGARVCLELIL